MYLQQQGFRKGNAGSNLYIKVNRDSILIIKFYINDIIFGSVDYRLFGIGWCTKEHCVSVSDLYTLHVQIYDYFKLGLLTNPKLGM
jgi:hypothetical protein